MYDVCDFVRLALIISYKNTLQTFRLKISIHIVPWLLCQVPYVHSFEQKLCQV